MKKLFTLLFGAALAFSLAMPVFAQDAGQGQEPAKKEHKMKKHHAKKAKKEKKAKKSAEGSGPGLN